MRRRPHPGASAIVTIALSAAALSLIFAASVSAEGPSDAAGGLQVTTDDGSTAAAAGGPVTVGHPRISPHGQEPSLPGDPTVWPPEEVLPLPSPKTGHDKCKRRHGNQTLPPWCFDLSSWPVYRTQTLTAKTTGIRVVDGVQPSTRRQHPRPINGPPKTERTPREQEDPTADEPRGRPPTARAHSPNRRP